jgi:hypothetical protein
MLSSAWCEHIRKSQRVWLECIKVSSSFVSETDVLKGREQSNPVILMHFTAF